MTGPRRRSWPRPQRPRSKRVATRGTCPTGKSRFATEADARRALTAAEADPASRREETRHYSCDQCAGWHLTSWPQWTPPPSEGTP